MSLFFFYTSEIAPTKQRNAGSVPKRLRRPPKRLGGTPNHRGNP